MNSFFLLSWETMEHRNDFARVKGNTPGSPNSKPVTLRETSLGCNFGGIPVSVWTESTAHVKKLPFYSFYKVRIEK